MRKAVRLYISGLLSSMFYKNFIMQHAKQYGIVGFMRKREDDGKMEIFIQGESKSVDAMVAVCKRGPTHAKIYEVKEQPERWQDDMKEFKLL
ncbi:acylphosphatase [Candidatus Pacearchaeota archaeon]|nr:acylphosphatase [Candidatus Pacearchaeota archaeon]